MSVQGIPTFSQTVADLRNTRNSGRLYRYGRTLSIVVLGAGPAGLIRTIQSLMDNHVVQVIEKRSEEARRPNTVMLKTKAIHVLTRYGIYQWLVENHKIFPDLTQICVRLGDLQDAMKAVIQAIAPDETIIKYQSTLKEINQENPQATLVIESTNGLESIEEVDLIVNAEGARSTTNELLNIGRVQVLANVPVVSGIFEDDRPKITGLCSLSSYLVKTVIQCATSVYYYAIFFFRFFFMGERFWNADRQISGSVILSTPNQNYVGCGLNPERSRQLMNFKKKIEELKAQLVNPENDEEIAQIQKELDQVEGEYHSFVKYWINLSFCAACFYAVFAKVFCIEQQEFRLTSRLPFKNFSVYEIGADKSDVSYQLLDETTFLVCGDALATVDPTTGLGANTAIESSSYFAEFLQGMRNNRDPHFLTYDYLRAAQNDVVEIHRQSRMKRMLYRPDATLAY